MSGHKFHGIQLAVNSNFGNFVVEHLAADPTSVDTIPLVHGRAWFNTSRNLFKYCDIDDGGALRVQSFTSAEALAAAVATLTSSISTLSTNATAAIATETSRAQTAEGVLTTNLAGEVSDRTTADSTESADRITGDATE